MLPISNALSALVAQQPATHTAARNSINSAEAIVYHHLVFHLLMDNWSEVQAILNKGLFSFSSVPIAYLANQHALSSHSLAGASDFISNSIYSHLLTDEKMARLLSLAQQSEVGERYKKELQTLVRTNSSAFIGLIGSEFYPKTFERLQELENKDLVNYFWQGFFSNDKYVSLYGEIFKAEPGLTKFLLEELPEIKLLNSLPDKDVVDYLNNLKNSKNKSLSNRFLSKLAHIEQGLSLEVCNINTLYHTHYTPIHKIFYIVKDLLNKPQVIEAAFMAADAAERARLRQSVTIGYRYFYFTQKSVTKNSVEKMSTMIPSLVETGILDVDLFLNARAETYFNQFLNKSLSQIKKRDTLSHIAPELREKLTLEHAVRVNSSQAPGSTYKV